MREIKCFFGTSILENLLPFKTKLFINVDGWAILPLFAISNFDFLDLPYTTFCSNLK